MLSCDPSNFYWTCRVNKVISESKSICYFVSLPSYWLWTKKVVKVTSCYKLTEIAFKQLWFK